MASRGGRSNCRAGIERDARASRSCLDVGRVGTRRRNFEVGAGRALPALGRQFSDAVPNAVADAACCQSPVPEQRTARADCGRCGLSNRYGFQSRISARLWIAASIVAPESIDSRRAVNPSILDGIVLSEQIARRQSARARASAPQSVECPGFWPILAVDMKCLSRSLILRCD